MIERATDGLAVLAVVSWINPGFYQWLSDFSQLMALLMPVLGSVWLAIQIAGAIRRNWKSIRKCLRRLAPWGNVHG